MSDQQDGIGMLRIGLKHVHLLEFVQCDDLLSRSPLLACQPAQERDEFLQSGRVLLVESGTRILDEGSAAQDLHFLLDGTIVLASGGGTVDLGTLSKGDFFGLAAVFPNAECPSAVATGGTARVAVFDSNRVRRLAETNPAVLELLLKVAKKRQEMAREGDDFLSRW